MLSLQPHHKREETLRKNKKKWWQFEENEAGGLRPWKTDKLSEVENKETIIMIIGL